VGDTLAGWKVGGGSIFLEDARHSSVIYIWKYFVVWPVLLFQRLAHPFVDPRLSKNMKASITSLVFKNAKKLGKAEARKKKLRR
jgi:hypothetical protein